MATLLFVERGIHHAKTNRTIDQTVVASRRSTLLFYHMWILNVQLKWFPSDSYCNLFNTFKPVNISQFLKIGFGSFILLMQSFRACAQKDRDKRAQYPGALSNSFAGVNIGYINYPFSNLQMEQGYHAESIH